VNTHPVVFWVLTIGSNANFTIILRRAGHVAGMGEKEMHRGIWWEGQKKGHHYEEADVVRRIILKWILEK
jgi:hypothetical protein